MLGDAWRCLERRGAARRVRCARWRREGDWAAEIAEIAEIVAEIAEIAEVVAEIAEIAEIAEVAQHKVGGAMRRAVEGGRGVAEIAEIALAKDGLVAVAA